MYIGSRITIFGRLLVIIDYGDIFTRKRFDQKEKTFAMIKPNSYLDIGKIIDIIEKNGFIISKCKLGRFSK